ncbi:MAG TPA: DNA polymerase IV [bacterium]|jgi:DNA polymerase-4
MDRKILHVDMDAFFAAVEQLRRPELQGKPVVVGGDGNPYKRGVVSTASYEARAFGIHSAMPLRTALQRCPHAVFLPVDFAAYGENSRRIRAIFHEYTTLVEPLSLDEAFLDVSERPESPLALAEEIRAAIKARTGLTASVGVGPNKLLAKIASNLHKPDAVTEIRAENVTELLKDLPASVLWGIGPKTAARLAAELNVHTVGELCDIPLAALQALLGEHHGEYLYHTCRGEDDSPVVTVWEPKSMSRETTYQWDTRLRDTIIKTIESLSDAVADDLRRDGYAGRTITVKIRYRDFKTHTRALTLPEPTGAADRIHQTAISLLDRFAMDRPVRLVGVRLSNLTKAGTANGEQGTTTD